MDIKVGVSNRHVHLNKEAYDILFNEEEFRVKNYLSQRGEFASELLVDIKTNGGLVKNVRVVGPLRDEVQVEISRSDSFVLKINPPVRMSGNFDSGEEVTLVNNAKEFKTRNCILAHRHIHASYEDLEKYGLNDEKTYRVRVKGERGGTMDNVRIKVKDNYSLELHIDTDEANAFLISNGDIVELEE